MNMKPYLALVVLAAMLFIPGCTKKRGGKLDAALNLRLDAIRQAGYPVTLAELSDFYAEPPAMENAAPLYLDAFAALAPLEAGSPAFLTQNKETLGLLHQAAARKRCRYPADLTKGANALLPHLAKFKKSAQLLSHQASNCASKGQIDLAVQSLLDGLRLGRSLEEEPLVLSHVMQIAAENMMQAALESMLGRKGFSEEHLALLQAAFHEAESGMPLARSLAGERCMGVAAFQLPPEEQGQM